MIKFTEDQQKIVDYILEQIQKPQEQRENVIISGAGGTGKTAMISEVVCMLLKMEKKVAIGAMTGKATAVLRSKINKNITENNMKGTFPSRNLKIETIQKLTKTSKVINVNENGETQYCNTWNDPADFDYDVFIIDELSMVPQFLSAWWRQTKALIIGLGDYCQLPEVVSDNKIELTKLKNELKIELPKKLTSGYGIKILQKLSQYSLSKVLRSDNEVALLSHDLRNFGLRKEEVRKVIKGWSEKAPNAVQYSRNPDDIESGPGWQIIAYTNQMCAKINNQLCRGNDEYPLPEDKILLFDNIPVIQKFNGDTMILNDFLKIVKNYNSKIEHETDQLTVILKWRNKLPRRNSPYKLEREMYVLYTQYKESMARAQKNRVEALPGIIQECDKPEEQKEKWLKDIEELKKENSNAGVCFANVIKLFENVDQDMVDYILQHAPTLPQVYFASIDYGYAITVHKSQGSQYEKTCYVMDRFDHPLLYTAVSRSEKVIKIIDLLDRQ